jgi:hypothetical protein
MAVPAPPYLLRLEPLDLLSRCHGWMGILARVIVNSRQITMEGLHASTRRFLPGKGPDVSNIDHSEYLPIA